ncbi:MAG: tRNA 2-selenouridine(34) synthase MnmH, partial [Flavobacteriales bacterium]|nr:tRNA 2-selenouridine(34) synthase MnmH [Flavobacteriales bacterium]
MSEDSETLKNDTALFTFLFQDEPFLLIDVRTPSEFRNGHIPGAINVPLFLDEERAAVGLLYKQKGSRAAIRAGLDYVGPRLSTLVKQVEDLLEQGENSPRLIIYCWRGGMRSASVAWLLRLYGMEPETIPGGYKSFRRFVNSIFTKPIPIAVLGGLTGSGKTLVLRQMQLAGIPVVDLEELACHQGSAFGHLGQPSQPSQEHFENLLALTLYRAGKKALDSGSVVWIEDESRFIGSLHLPLPLWQRMQEAPLFLMPD